MRTFDPCLIKRIGIAVEMADGEQIMFYIESPGTEIQIENRNETQQVFVGNITRTLITDSTTEITISGIRGYQMHTRAPESTAQSIDRIHEITGGNPDDYRLTDQPSDSHDRNEPTPHGKPLHEKRPRADR